MRIYVFNLRHAHQYVCIYRIVVHIITKTRCVCVCLYQSLSIAIPMYIYYKLTLLAICYCGLYLFVCLAHSLCIAMHVFGCVQRS